jgi:amidohydrolase
MKTGNTFKCSSYLGYEVMEIGRAIADAKEIFYRLHRHPELSGQEFKTTEYIKQVLSDNDIPVYPLPLNTGLVAHLGCSRHSLSW